MEMKEMIERAEQEAGSQKALALTIGVSESNIRSAKSGMRGLPSFACPLIADLIGEQTLKVIAANELITEKKAERRKVWEKVLRQRIAATIAAFFVAVVFFVTPTPSQAAPVLQAIDSTLYIMSNSPYSRLPPKPAPARTYCPGLNSRHFSA